MPQGVQAQAQAIALDMLILATGYDGLTVALTAFDLVSRDGRTVNEKRKDGARSQADAESGRRLE